MILILTTRLDESNNMIIFQEKAQQYVHCIVITLAIDCLHSCQDQSHNNDPVVLTWAMYKPTPILGGGIHQFHVTYSTGK